jgi:heme/copper-type cytochrome/quinol oxidase subunit 2
MDAIKKILGIVWLALAAVIAYYGIGEFGMMKVMSDKQEDQVFGIIIIGVLMPIVVGGLAVFGWYSLQGEYSANKK